VRVVATAWGDLKGLLRMRWRRLVGPGGCRWRPDGWLFSRAWPSLLRVAI